MAIQDVQGEWLQYRLLVKAMYTGINSPNALKSAIGVIGPLPDDPGKWDDWLHALGFLGALSNAVQVTDAALEAQQEFVVSTNILASTVALPAPDQGQVTTFINELQIVNGYIKQDQRFSAALKIGAALADAVQKNLLK